MVLDDGRRNGPLQNGERGRAGNTCCVVSGTRVPKSEGSKVNLIAACLWDDKAVSQKNGTAFSREPGGTGIFDGVKEEGQRGRDAWLRGTTAFEPGGTVPVNRLGGPETGAPGRSVRFKTDRG
ncbi:hypothetical protein H6P81_012332 [Aristolochia fimbriata]|uniref:Uncharacterized protein n=1 Tax=Aristolochia fimbriata TaxID=158543 RepID=A0AAV7EC20_ARIFI|nr:hypothetical protein H6P81_012332 [Aristolochia fimbriata]